MLVSLYCHVEILGVGAYSKVLAWAPESILALRSAGEPLRCGSFTLIITKALSVVAALERLSTGIKLR